jgi:hypothetical protein
MKGLNRPSRLGIIALALAGCATPGETHVYALADSTAETIRDLGPTAPSTAPSFIAPGESVAGFAYDPFTDHFFLRLAPGNRIRVVDRPARAIKREFVVDALPQTGGGDMAIRPRDGHIFFAHPEKPEVIETNRFGQYVRTISLEKIATPPQGLAFDTRHTRFLVLENPGVARVTIHDLAGKQLDATMLSSSDIGPSLAFDSEKREYYAASRRDRQQIAVFDETGKFLRTVSAPTEFVDVGPRSFIRVF